MEFKGTKGKWTIEKDKEYSTLHNIWSDAESILVSGTLIARTCYAPLSEANAQLISKAPELLDALYELVCAFENNALKNVDFAKALIKEATELK